MIGQLLVYVAVIIQTSIRSITLRGVAIHNQSVVLNLHYMYNTERSIVLLDIACYLLFPWYCVL